MGGYDGRRGHPVVLGRDHWAGVAGDRHRRRGRPRLFAGTRADVTVVPCGDIADDTDLDTPDGQDTPDPGAQRLDRGRPLE